MPKQGFPGFSVSDASRQCNESLPYTSIIDGDDSNRPRARANPCECQYVSHTSKNFEAFLSITSSILATGDGVVRRECRSGTAATFPDWPVARRVRPLLQPAILGCN